MVTEAYIELKKIADRLREAIFERMAEDTPDLAPSPWLRERERGSYPHVWHVIAYAVRGASEGYWVHVDFVYSARIREAAPGVAPEVGGAIPVEHTEAYPVETVILGKLDFGGDIGRAAEAARIATLLIDEEGMFEDF